jgi:hypothetical protein
VVALESRQFRETAYLASFHQANGLLARRAGHSKSARNIDGHEEFNRPRQSVYLRTAVTKETPYKSAPIRP